jgi:hypothetical protein
MLVYSKEHNRICILVTSDINSEKAIEIFDTAFSLDIHPTFKIKQAVSAVTKHEAHLPTVLIGITVDRGSLFLPEFFEKIWNLKYPKNKIDIFISCQCQNQLQFVKKLAEDWKMKNDYRSVEIEKEFKGKTHRETVTYWQSSS